MKNKWLFSTIGKRGYLAEYFRAADPSVYVIGSGRTIFTPGFASCNENVIVPEIKAPEYLDAVRKLVQDYEISAIISLADPDVDKLSTIRTELAASGVSCFFPDRNVARMGYDKWETAQWAIHNDVHIPVTACNPTMAAEHIKLPMIRKPRFGSASVGVSVIRNACDIAPPAGDTTQYIYQEFIDGVEVNIEFCGDLTGNPVAISAWKKIVSRNGETELAVTTRRDDLIELGKSLCDKARIAGPCDVDVIERNGELHLIEFNMRFGGGYPVSYLAGANFPRLMLEIHSGKTPALDTSFKDEIFMMKSLRPFGGHIKDAPQIFRKS
jgi:carbamoyl-phosphate synthase large subunit